MKTLSASVGAWEKAAVNRYADVVTVQELLQTAVVKRNQSGFNPGAVDGKIARAPMLSSTVKAIKAFQQTFMSTPDGLIEPNKTTLRKLNEITDSGIPNVTPPPPAAVVADKLVFPSGQSHFRFEPGGWQGNRCSMRRV
jgi:peptidoglycan hydrolase-like protein with peptidoglycan-binding domain